MFLVSGYTGSMSSSILTLMDRVGTVLYVISTVISVVGLHSNLISNPHLTRVRFSEQKYSIDYCWRSGCVERCVSDVLHATSILILILGTQASSRSPCRASSSSSPGSAHKRATQIKEFKLPKEFSQQDGRETSLISHHSGAWMTSIMDGASTRTLIPSRLRARTATKHKKSGAFDDERGEREYRSRHSSG